MYGNSYDYYDYYDYGYSYSSGPDFEEIFGIIALIAAAVLMILSFIFIIPAKKRDKLPGFFRVVHDIFNFNGLIIEVLLKAAYIFATIFTILFSFLMIFTGDDVEVWLLSLVLGPIAIRIAFEFIMMAVLLVKNVMSINQKLKYPDDEKGKNKDSFGFDYTRYTTGNTANPNPVQAPQTYANTTQTPPAAPATKPVCPNCGCELEGNEAFCGKCGIHLNK